LLEEFEQDSFRAEKLNKVVFKKLAMGKTNRLGLIACRLLFSDVPDMRHVMLSHMMWTTF